MVLVVICIEESWGTESCGRLLVEEARERARQLCECKLASREEREREVREFGHCS